MRRWTPVHRDDAAVTEQFCRRIDQLNPPGDAVSLVCPHVPPVKIVPNEVVRQKQIVINKQKIPHARTRKHHGDLAPERTAPNNRNLASASAIVILIQSRHERLRAE